MTIESFAKTNKLPCMKIAERIVNDDRMFAIINMIVPNLNQEIREGIKK